ncbi:MAG: hypothetical protein R2837_11360 [Aliarcobacter sp.]
MKTKFIELTIKYGESSPKSILVNTDNIIYIESINSHTIINFNSTKGNKESFKPFQLLVLETYLEIQEKLKSV